MAARPSESCPTRESLQKFSMQSLSGMDVRLVRCANSCRFKFPAREWIRIATRNDVRANRLQRLERRRASGLGCGRRWIRGLSGVNDPVSRTIAFARVRGDETQQAGRRRVERVTTERSAVASVVVQLQDLSLRGAWIHAGRIRYGIERCHDQQRAQNPNYAPRPFHLRLCAYIQGNGFLGRFQVSGFRNRLRRLLYLVDSVADSHRVEVHALNFFWRRAGGRFLSWRRGRQRPALRRRCAFPVRRCPKSHRDRVR